MICTDCKDSPTKICLPHARTSNHDSQMDLEMEAMRAELAEAKAQNVRLRVRIARARSIVGDIQHGPDCDPKEEYCECGLDDVLAELRVTP